MSKEAGAEDPKSVRAKAALQQMKDTLDGVIEPAAPGFGQYLQNFADASRSIVIMEVLQKHENKLYDTQNRMQYSRVQGMMRQIVDSRAAPGISQYKSIPDETMGQLFSLRDDLRRAASAEDLARANGSDTAQNFRDSMMGMGKLAGEGVLHGVANAVSPGFGSMGLAIAKNALAPIMAGRQAAKQTAQGLQMLHPDPNLLRNPSQD